MTVLQTLFFLEDTPEKADIILIPGGNRLSLMEKAADLYLQGLAPYILPSGGYNKKIPDWESEWEFLKDIAIKKGVPEEAILKENKALNTFDNAILSWEVIKDKGLDVKKALFVCKAYHARRATMTYWTAFPKEVKFIICPVIDDREIRKNDWFLDKKKTEVVMSEVEKIGKYFGKHIPNWVK